MPKQQGVSGAGLTYWQQLLLSCIGARGSSPRLCGRRRSPQVAAGRPTSCQQRRTPQEELPFASVTFGRGQYRLVRELGSGAYGDVFLARHPATGDCVAVKRHTRAADGFRDFEASLRLARALKGAPEHPLIVRLLDHVVQDAERLTVMELCPCGDLQGLLAALGSEAAFSEAEAAFFVLEVAEAIGHLHERGVCHLDVRPCNILLSRRGHCRLADFSICEVTDGLPAATFTVRLSSRGRWLPPEILANRASPGGRFTDWFSLGALAASITTGAGRPSAEFCHFVCRLTDRDRGVRLGSQRGVAEVLSHGFVTRRAARLLRLPADATGSLVGLRLFLRSQRLSAPARVLRALAGAE